MKADEQAPSEEAPVYRKVYDRRDDGTRSSLCMITCDEGWRSLIVCTDMYEHVADWLLDLIGGKPYPAKAGK